MVSRDRDAYAKFHQTIEMLEGHRAALEVIKEMSYQEHTTRHNERRCQVGLHNYVNFKNEELLVCRLCGYLEPLQKPKETVCELLASEQTVVKHFNGHIDREGTINFDKSY